MIYASIRVRLTTLLMIVAGFFMQSGNPVLAQNDFDRIWAVGNPCENSGVAYGYTYGADAIYFQCSYAWPLPWSLTEVHITCAGVCDLNWTGSLGNYGIENKGDYFSYLVAAYGCSGGTANTGLLDYSLYSVVWGDLNGPNILYGETVFQPSLISTVFKDAPASGGALAHEIGHCLGYSGNNSTTVGHVMEELPQGSHTVWDYWDDVWICCIYTMEEGIQWW